MKLEVLRLQDFRNYADQTFRFESERVVFCGPNGLGKTNVLEAISVLSVGKSWRETSSKDLIADFTQDSALVTLQTELDTFRVNIGSRSRTFTKNKKALPRTRLIGQIPTLLFCPEYLHLFSGTKLARVQFFDRILVQIYPQYREKLSRATKAHKQKTRLLRTEESPSASHLAPWNAILVETMPVIMQIRQEFLDLLNQELPKELQKITGRSESLHIGMDLAEPVEASSASIEDFFMKHQERELAARKNFIAPTRDDFVFYLRDMPVVSNASRGETRSVLLAMLSAQKYIFQEHLKRVPILLLDDVFSELDDYRQTHLEQLCEGAQVFFTTTHKAHFDGFKSDVQVFEL